MPNPEKTTPAAAETKTAPVKTQTAGTTLEHCILAALPTVVNKHSLDKVEEIAEAAFNIGSALYKRLNKK